MNTSLWNKDKILIFFTINYTIFAPLNVWYLQSTLYQQFPSSTSPKPQYCIQILRSELLENARQYFGNPKAWEKKSWATNYKNFLQ